MIRAVPACEAQEANPPGDRPATLRQAGDSCLSLEPAAFEPTRLGAEARFEAAGGGWYIQLTLAGDDASRFDALARRHRGRQLAVVVAGHVVSAPVLQSAEFAGKPTITGDFTEEQARRIADAIRR